MSQGFERFTKEQVEAHNAKVRAGQGKFLHKEEPAPPPVIPQPVDNPKVALTLSETTDVDRLNKLEKAFYQLLQVSGHAGIWVQSVQLKLGWDVRYLPDFVVLTRTGDLIAYETKGHRWAKNMIKLRMAARAFPFIRFILVSKEQGVWKYEEMKP